MLKDSNADNLKLLAGIIIFISGVFVLAADADAAVTAPMNYEAAGCLTPNIGDVTGRTYVEAGVQSFDKDYTLTGLKIKLRAVGTPTDDLKIELFDSDRDCSPDADCPFATGSVLASNTISPTNTASFEYQTTMDWGSIPYDVLSGGDFAIRFSRTGAIDAANYYELHTGCNGSDPEVSPVATYTPWTLATGEPMFYFEGDETISPRCSITSANVAWSNTGSQTIHAVGSCQDFTPTTAWIGAVRYDPVGVHAAWSEGYGPFPDPYTLDTADLPHQTLPNGTYRVRMYGQTGGVTYVSSNYVDVVLDGDPFGALTVGGDPGDWVFSEDDTPLSASSTGVGYTISASAAALAAGGGLSITRQGCATIGEDATSTECVFAENSSFLRNHFPLLTWPVGLFDAFYDAYLVFDASATPAYAITITGQGDWIPDLTLVDSASSGAGIGRYITAAHFAFLYSVLELSLWLFFVRAMYRKYQSLL